jgi:hypothetical protein
MVLNKEILDFKPGSNGCPAIRYESKKQNSAFYFYGTVYREPAYFS